jgi:NAD-dependent DNA ligase
MEKLTTAENFHLLNENQALRKNLVKNLEKAKFVEFDDLMAALSISEIQRERLSFLKKELEYVENRKNCLIEEESIIQSLQKIQNLDNLEERLNTAKYKKAQIEMQLEGLERKKTRELSEIKKNSAKQDASLLLNL